MARRTSSFTDGIVRQPYTGSHSGVRRGHADRRRSGHAPLPSGRLRHTRRGDVMSAGPPRVAFFTDSFHEVNGVALTSREFVRFAARRSLPMFSAHAGPRTCLTQEGSVTTFEFHRGLLKWRLEHDLAIDFALMRYLSKIRRALEEFKPDLVHITGPSDSGILGALLAYRLGVPLAASWHINLHEFGARSLSQMLGFLPEH